MRQFYLYRQECSSVRLKFGERGSSFGTSFYLDSISIDHLNGRLGTVLVWQRRSTPHNHGDAFT